MDGYAQLIDETSELVPANILRSTRFLDITDNPELMELARQQVVETYLQFAAPELSPANVYDDLTHDGYEDPQSSRTIAAVTTIGDSPNAPCVISGTTRLIFGPDEQHHSMPPISAMQLMTCPVWPHSHLVRERGGTVVVGELSRFIISRPFRTPAMKRAGVSVGITQGLFAMTSQLSRLLRVDCLYGVAHPYTIEWLGIADIASTLVSLAKPRRGDPIVEHLYAWYPGYWNERHPPHLYRIWVDEDSSNKGRDRVLAGLTAVTERRFEVG